MAVSEKAMAAIVSCLSITGYRATFYAVDPADSNLLRYGAFYLPDDPAATTSRWQEYVTWSQNNLYPTYYWESQWRYWIYENFWDPYDTAAQFSSIADFITTTVDDTYILCRAFLEGSMQAGGIYPSIYADYVPDIIWWIFENWNEHNPTAPMFFNDTDTEEQKEFVRGYNGLYWFKTLYNMARPIPDDVYKIYIPAIVSKRRRKIHGGSVSRKRYTGIL